MTRWIVRKRMGGRDVADVVVGMVLLLLLLIVESGGACQ